MRVLNQPVVASPLVAIVLLIFAGVACSGNDNKPPTETPQSTAVPTSTPTPTPSAPPTPTTAPVTSPEPAATAASSPDVAPRASEQSVQLPHDEGVHLSGLEWFYFNGHLTAENGQEFSYHFVTFQTVQPSGLTSRLTQLSWADHAEMLHLTGEKAAAPLPVASSGEFDLSTDDWRMSGNGEEYQLSFGVGEYTVELEAVSQRPAVLHHGSGLVDLGVAGKTYYYSRTRLATSGTVSVAGVSHAVTGVSWMDHQWGEFTTLGIGWDWLSLNLDDGSDLTVSVVWEQEGHKHGQHLRYLRPGRRFPNTPARRRRFARIRWDLGQPCHRGCVPRRLEVASRLAGAGPFADSLNGGGRIRPEHVHPRDLLGGVGFSDGHEAWHAGSGSRLR